MICEAIIPQFPKKLKYFLKRAGFINKLHEINLSDGRKK